MRTKPQHAGSRRSMMFTRENGRPRKTLMIAISVAVFTLVWHSVVFASYGIYVGKNFTADASVFLAGYGDEPSSHWLEIVPRRDYPPNASIKVGGTAAARYPGVLIEIPQVAQTLRYITMNYS